MEKRQTKSAFGIDIEGLVSQCAHEANQADLRKVLVGAAPEARTAPVAERPAPE